MKDAIDESPNICQLMFQAFQVVRSTTIYMAFLFLLTILPLTMLLMGNFSVAYFFRAIIFKGQLGNFEIRDQISARMSGRADDSALSDRRRHRLAVQMHRRHLVSARALRLLRLANCFCALLSELRAEQAGQHLSADLVSARQLLDPAHLSAAWQTGR